MSKKDFEASNKKLVEECKKTLLLKKNKGSKKDLPLRPTTMGRIWFYLTCLRPITKWEIAHVSQAIISNRQLLNKMAFQMNDITLKVAEIVGYLKGRDSIPLKNKSDEVKKEVKKRMKRKDTGMYM